MSEETKVPAMDVYIGKKRVQQQSRVEQLNMVSVKYDDNTTEDYSLRQFDAVKSDEPYDEGQVQIRKWKPLVKDILTGMLADSMNLGDKDFILGRVEESLVHNYEAAICKIMGDVEHVNFINLKDVDYILKDNETETKE